MTRLKFRARTLALIVGMLAGIGIIVYKVVKKR